ncbi:MAG: hypothetical protein WD078_16330, partial [Woeseia sp.]
LRQSQRKNARGHKNPVLDGIYRLAADADRLGQLRLRQACLSAGGPVERFHPVYNRTRTDRLVTEGVVSV